ncbi:MAG TPA: hypothetical protein VGB17_16365 [Pyrinomonadaceae bacterium]|jgi:hypothetical protein
MKRETLAGLQLTALMRFALIFALALLLCGQAATHAYAKKTKKPNYGRLRVSTNPGGFDLRIDKQPLGATTLSVRELDLSPGKHTVEIQFPNDILWTRELIVDPGRIYCIALNHTPTTFTVTKSPCPYPVNVSAPSNVNDGDVITFSADATYGGSSALNYTWTVSPASARIISGAGTPTIMVDSAGLGGQRVTAVLVVDDGSGDRNCRQAAQAATEITTLPMPVITPKKFDEFPSVAFDDDKARLDNLAIELQNTPNAQGYIIVYSGRRSRPGQADRLGARARNYLSNTRGIDASRIVIVNGGVRETDTFELWIVPQGAQPPQAAPGAMQQEMGAEARPRRSRRD